MLPSTTSPDSAIRRLMREGANRPRAPQPTAGPTHAPASAPTLGIEEDVELTIRQLKAAATEMDRLRATVASHEAALYEQKQELAKASGEIADARARLLQADQLMADETSRSERVKAQLEAELTTLRSQIARLTAAINGSFGSDGAIPLRAVA